MVNLECIETEAKLVEKDQSENVGGKDWLARWHAKHAQRDERVDSA